MWCSALMHWCSFAVFTAGDIRSSESQCVGSHYICCSVLCLQAFAIVAVAYGRYNATNYPHASSWIDDGVNLWFEQHIPLLLLCSALISYRCLMLS
jgi:hypothetical protein